MDKQPAVLLLDEYMRGGDALDLDDKAQQRVIRKLQWLEKADINNVAQIAEEENQMYRGNAPTQPTQKSQQTQSRDEMKQIIALFLDKYWQTVTRAIPPVNENGIQSPINYRAFSGALNSETVVGTGKLPIRHDVLSELVIRLDQAKLLEHPPAVVERVIEKQVSVPLTRKQTAVRNFDLDVLMNSSDSPIKGINEETVKRPRVSDAELAAQARHDLRENETMGDVRSVIAGHAHSGSHAATKYEREILTNLMNTGIRQNLSAETILANVKAKQDTMAKWGPQQALKELNPQLFTSQPKAAGY